MIVERISRYIAAPGPPGDNDFAALALLAFAFQFERIAPYRRLCEACGATPATVTSWRQVPAVPAAAFRTLTLATAPAVEVFRSSGTTGGGEGRSVHYHPYPELYRQAVDASFPRFCMPPGAGPRLPILALIPSRELVPDSSL